MKLLIVKLHALGDMVIATPAIRRLREAYPNARIELLTTDWAEPAIRNSTLVDEVISVSASYFFKSDMSARRGLLTTLFDVRSRHYDVSVAFHLSRSIHRWLALSGIKRRFGFGESNTNTGIKLNELRHSALSACDLSDHAIRMLSGGSPLAAELSDVRYEWQISETEAKTARELLEENRIAKPFAVLFPGGGANPSATAPERRWPTNGYASLAAWLIQARGLDVLLMGGPSDVAPADEIVRSLRMPVRNFAGKTDLRLTAAIASMATIAVSNDSAPMHISAAVGTPTLGIFGPTGARTKLPLGANCGAISLGLPCSPCYFSTFKGCIFSTIRCMDELPAQKVIDAAASILDKSRMMSDE